MKKTGFRENRQRIVIEELRSKDADDEVKLGSAGSVRLRTLFVVAPRLHTYNSR